MKFVESPWSLCIYADKVIGLLDTKAFFIFLKQLEISAITKMFLHQKSGGSITFIFYIPKSS